MNNLKSDRDFTVIVDWSDQDEWKELFSVLNSEWRKRLPKRPW